MTTVKFDVQMSPLPHIGEIMRSSGWCDSVAIHQVFIITWKDGEIVDEARKQRTKEQIKASLEDLDYDCYSISEIQ